MLHPDTQSEPKHCYFLFLACIPASGFAANAQTELPKDVANYLDRKTECDHWEGEEPYDAARSDYLAQARHTNRCDDLVKDQKRLKAKYKKNSEILDALNSIKAPD